jgi:hypothetical protein
MPVLFFLFVRLVVEAIRAIVYKAPTVKPKPLCVECSYAHVQYGAKGQRAVSCTYGGMVRPVTLDVLYCTDYCNRNIQIRTAKIGFALRKPEVEVA